MLELRWQFFLVSAPILRSSSSMRMHFSASSCTCFSSRWSVVISGILMADCRYLASLQCTGGGGRQTEGEYSHQKRELCTYNKTCWTYSEPHCLLAEEDCEMCLKAQEPLLFFPHERSHLTFSNRCEMYFMVCCASSKPTSQCSETFLIIKWLLTHYNNWCGQTCTSVSLNKRSLVSLGCPLGLLQYKSDIW